jgi:hypothetical protein
MGKMFKKDRMHTLTCITQTLFFTFNYLELNKLKIFKWKFIHFILPCKELLKQWRIVNNSDCLVCKEPQGFQSGQVPGTFTRLRSCIVPEEITEPPKISGKVIFKTGNIPSTWS